MRLVFVFLPVLSIIIAFHFPLLLIVKSGIGLIKTIRENEENRLLNTF